jgi:CRP-like cAMP-binding protein
MSIHNGKSTVAKAEPFGTTPLESRFFGGEVGCASRSETRCPMTQGRPPKFDAEAFLKTVGQGKTVQQFKKNEIIYAQGDVSEHVYFVQKGGVKLTVVSEYGKEAVVGLVEAGQFFGEACLKGQSHRLATTSAMTDTVLTSINKGAMLAALQDEPEFCQRFINYLLARTSRIEGDLIDQLFNSSERRLARLLLILAHFGDEGVPQPNDFEMDQATLANMIGTTRSRVNFFMNKFRKLGLISYNGKIHVNNSLLNAVLHNKPDLSSGDDA